MKQHTGLVGCIVGVSGRMGTPVDNKNPEIALGRKTLRKDSPGKSGAHHQDIVLGGTHPCEVPHCAFMDSRHPTQRASNLLKVRNTS